MGVGVALVALLASLGTFAAFQGTGRAQQRPVTVPGEAHWTSALVDVLRPPMYAEEQAIVVQLNLNPSQRRQLADLDSDFERSASTLRARHRELMRRIAASVSSGQINQAAVKRNVSDILETERQIVQKELKYYDGLVTILTRQQRRQLWDLFVKGRLGQPVPGARARSAR